jgi:hypothetical protein
VRDDWAVLMRPTPWWGLCLSRANEQSQWTNATGLFRLIQIIICRIIYRKYAEYAK